jgi:hypothetical protein
MIYVELNKFTAICTKSRAAGIAQYNVQTGSEARPEAVSAKVTQQRRVANSPPSPAEVRNDGAIPPFPIRLHGVMFN